MPQPCFDMRKDSNGEFVHTPEETRFRLNSHTVLIETRCAECAHILDSTVINSVEEQSPQS